MSFQAYLDNIKTKTGKTADDFKRMAAEKNLIKTADIMSWLKSDYGLGHGHAMAIVHLIVHKEHIAAGADERIDKLFSGGKAKWRKVFDEIVSDVKAFGEDVEISAGQTYVNLQRGGKKFGIVQPSSAERFDIGIKLKGAQTTATFETAGSWNAMVTHRVRITNTGQLDAEIVAWLKKAYDAVES